MFWHLSFYMDASILPPKSPMIFFLLSNFGYLKNYFESSEFFTSFCSFFSISLRITTVIHLKEYLCVFMHIPQVNSECCCSSVVLFFENIINCYFNHVHSLPHLLQKPHLNTHMYVLTYVSTH